MDQQPARVPAPHIDQVIVRPITLEDAEVFHRLVSRERDRLRLYFPMTVERTADPVHTAAYVAELVARASVPEMRCHLVWIEGTEEPVGVVFLKNFDLRVMKCELAYFTALGAQGRSVATNAVAWAVDEAFRRYNLQRVFVRIDPSNAASVRVVEKNGFVEEGILRRDHRTSDGRLLDVLILAKLRA